MRLLVDCRVFNLGWRHSAVYVYLYSAFSNVNLVDWTDFSLSVVPRSRWIRLVGPCILYDFIARCGLSLEIMDDVQLPCSSFFGGRMVRYGEAYNLPLFSK